MRRAVTVCVLALGLPCALDVVDTPFVASDASLQCARFRVGGKERTDAPRAIIHSLPALARPVPTTMRGRTNVPARQQLPVIGRVNMSESYGAMAPNDVITRDEGGSLETAKREASDLKDTAVSEAGHVAETAKDEVKAVAQEVKYQAKDLYAQTQRELRDQAHTQQQRLATGLSAAGRELDSMTAHVDSPGLATDAVRQVSARLTSAATWLADRDPGSVLAEVKSFARRRPGTFIIGAAVLGILAGRLTRALASNASDDHTDSTDGVGSPRAAVAIPPAPDGQPGATPPTVEETPVFAQSSASRGTQLSQGDVGDVRSDSF